MPFWTNWGDKRKDRGTKVTSDATGHAGEGNIESQFPANPDLGRRRSLAGNKLGSNLASAGGKRRKRGR
jgi:hypothetical protein